MGTHHRDIPLFLMDKQGADEAGFQNVSELSKYWNAIQYDLISLEWDRLCLRVLHLLICYSNPICILKMFSAFCSDCFYMQIVALKS